MTGDQCTSELPSLEKFSIPAAGPPPILRDSYFHAQTLLNHLTHLEGLLRHVRETRNALPSLVRAAEKFPRGISLEECRPIFQENKENVVKLKHFVADAQDAFHSSQASRALDKSDLIATGDPDETAIAVDHFKTLISQREGGSLDDCQTRAQFSLRAPEPGFEAAVGLVNRLCGMEAVTWNRSITRPGRTSWVEINVKGVLRALVTLREYPDRVSGLKPITFIERGVCFGAHEPQKRVYEQSSYGLFQSISRCLTQVIKEHSIPGSDNVYLVCTFLASYLDLFQCLDPTASTNTSLNPSQSASPTTSTGRQQSALASRPKIWRVWRRRGIHQEKGWDPIEEPVG